MIIVIIYNYIHTIIASRWSSRWSFFYFEYIEIFMIFRWDIHNLSSKCDRLNYYRFMIISFLFRMNFCEFYSFDIDKINSLMKRGLDNWNEIRWSFLLYILYMRQISIFFLRIDNLLNRWSILIYYIKFENWGFSLWYIRFIHQFRYEMKEIDDVSEWYLIDKIIEKKYGISNIFSSEIIILIWR